MIKLVRLEYDLIYHVCIQVRSTRLLELMDVNFVQSLGKYQLACRLHVYVLVTVAYIEDLSPHKSKT